MIPQAVIDQIQDRSDIATVIQQYIPLKRAGRSFKSTCPFHTEKSPSFVVSPEKQIFHCFGCGAGGNVFTFVMKYDKLNFREAVELLAERAGVVIPEDESAAKPKVDLQPLYDVNAFAADFYVKTLHQQSKESRVWKYIKSREIPDRSLERFKVGFAPDAWDGLIKAASSKFSQTTLEKAGLILPRQSGDGFYDRFRGRVTFPINDVRGRIIGFGARVLDDSTPKYVNTPETDVYHKSKVLYGFFEGLDAIRKENRVVLVEGYTDVMACHEAGIGFAVASSGTALTNDQIRLMKRYTSQITVLYDADNAGQAATLRGLDLLIEEGCQVTVARMPQGEDPDSFVRRFGGDAFRKKVLDVAIPLFDYKYDVLKSMHPDTAEGKAKIAQDMILTLRRIPNEILKSSLVQELASRTGIAIQAIQREMQKAGSLRSAPVQGTSAAATNVRMTKAPSVGSGEMSMGERLVLGLMMNFEPVWQKAKGELTPVFFQTQNAQWLAERILSSREWQDVRPAKLMNAFQEDAQALLTIRNCMHEVEMIEEPETAYADCLNKIRRSDDKKRRVSLKERIVASERSKDWETRNSLLKEFEQASRKEKEAHG